MRRLLVILVLVFGGGCHRLTGRSGDGAVYRHFNGWMVASEVSMWLGLGGAAVGLGFMAYYIIDRDFDRVRLGWAAVLAVVGLTMAAAALFSWYMLVITPS